MRRPVKGPLPFGAWVNIYEERDESCFELTDGEELYFDRDRGFFTWSVDFDEKLLLIPKMVGDGRHFRQIIYDLFVQLRDAYGLRAVYCCTKRNPKVYMRVLGGRLIKREVSEGKFYSYIEITPEDTPVKSAREEAENYGREKQDSDSAKA